METRLELPIKKVLLVVPDALSGELRVLGVLELESGNNGEKTLPHPSEASIQWTHGIIRRQWTLVVLCSCSIAPLDLLGSLGPIYAPYL